MYVYMYVCIYVCMYIYSRNANDQVKSLKYSHYKALGKL